MASQNALRGIPMGIESTPGTAAPPKPPPPQKPLRPWKCCRCGRVLLFVYLTPGTVLEIVCPDCQEQQSRTATR